MEAYHKKVFHSHRVLKKSDGSNVMEISSFPLCSLIKNRLGYKHVF